ncbi:unnamed protein product [Rotaria socialis]|uniref:Uncharacterized protein n=1 Tax=Rotaria socialis TaxID=392032 RepID=A0A818B576_9BILA|nr:unnamed protein product [Rotaria socialis]CAF3601731.1 unnamed protein product [Rotaria socialis]CAF4389291.1 unnamed protein product [Rotaria socialis]CAF4406483.1 unnamed protein product [Rotaria socialis]
MSSGMASLLVCLATLSSSLVVLAQRGESCKAMSSPIYDCSQTIYSDCKNATFVTDRSTFSKNCSQVSLFWDAPLYNMTLLFDSDLIGPYELCLERMMCTTAFLTKNDGSEVEIKWEKFNEPVCFKSQQDIPIMQFRFDAGERWHCYGSFINFFFRQ